MNSTKLISLCGIMVFGGLVTMSGCNHEGGEGSPSGDEGNTANVNLAFTGGVFDGNSVRIVATRDGIADSKYPCVSYAVGCFNFLPGSNGVPTPYDAGAELFEDLCPTEDVNQAGDYGSGLWTFTYEIFNDLNCSGEEITGANFSCFSPDDIASQTYENQTYQEELEPGLNVNTLLCLSQNAEKVFDFNVCTIEEPPAGYSVALDCNCQPDAYYSSCMCDFDVSGIPAGCVIDPAQDCNIVCY
ncbi:hypothetical protein [Polyangium sp. 6x1]|uniref:hypothetical protein n=1 Tax=Polyangium sp. 6x1 TaxID=3042689 RepID=UPI0024832512|nr:hypothetical protein [Polyangium sp. 6x1]MDI1448657.1 hypothetical protein [Polyangium sp. 6x1]